MITQKEVAKYLKQVRRFLPYPFKKKLVTELQNNISDFLDENPNSTYDNFISHFGTPQKFADEYILSVDEDTRKKAIHKTKWIKRCIIIGISVIILIALITAIWIICENSQTVITYYSEGIE